MAVRLQWGRGVAVPDGTEVAWGARWIAPADLVWDRQAWHAPEGADHLEATTPLANWLNSGPLAAAKLESARLFREGQWHGGSEDERVLFEDANGRIVGSPQGSGPGGYVYVAAWLQELRTPGGRVLTNDDLEALADEAQEGHPDA
jgi:hypothetical protein